MIKTEQRGCRVSDSAVCSKGKCMAQLTVRRVKKVNTKFKLEANGKNPTSTFCESLKGKPVVGKDKNNNDVPICQFSDSSFVYGWDLYNLAY